MAVSRAFNYDLDFKTTNFRQHPELYRVGRGEQGVLLADSQGSHDRNNALQPQQADALTNEKARAAAIFKAYWFRAKAHPGYDRMKSEFIKALK